MAIIDGVPAFLTAGALAVTLIYLRSLARDARLRLWAVGWSLVFEHCLVQLLEPKWHAHSLFLAIDTATLLAASGVFLLSVLPRVDEVLRRVSVMFGLTAILLCAAAGQWMVPAEFRLPFETGIAALLFIAFAVTGCLALRNWRGPSPAVVTLSGGFLSWSITFPMRQFLEHGTRNITVPAELWNIPMIIVGLGMILTIMEEKSASIAILQGKALRLNRQMERFSAISTRLLEGVRVDAIGDDIAFAITSVSPFRVAVIQIENVDHTWHVAGSCGLSEERLSALRTQVQEWSSEAINDVCSRALRIGPNTLFISEPYSAGDCPDPAQDGTHHWIMPLRSSIGTCLGCITLTDPEDISAVNPDELSGIESLAANMAMALELKSMQTQLQQAGKLAAVGQLVAGVAHELNNPLTAVMGYGELVTDEVGNRDAHNHMVKLVDETRRMKKIVDNLLKFSRTNRVRKPATRLADVVYDVLELREYDMRLRGIQATVHFETRLSLLAIDDDKLRQILLNLLNNSIDAMDLNLASKQIKIRAWQTVTRTIISVEDTGTGFKNLHRAVDPFYTTKPAGKGTGLGLSICRSIVREHGGNLRVENLTPQGARVIFELPVAEGPSSAAVLPFAVGAPA